MAWKMVASWRIPSVGICVPNYEAQSLQLKIQGPEANPALTFKKGGPPTGNWAYNPGWEWALTAPPIKDQKFSWRAFCQSDQILSTI